MDRDDTNTNLIVNYLPQALTDEEFLSLFEKFGELKSCKICRHKATNYSYGFGFADFVHHEDAMRAVQELNGMQVQHKRIKVAFSRPPEEAGKRANVYVKNLPRDYSEDDVKQLFGQYGNIVNVRILRDPVTNISKTVAFVLYDKRTEAELAINQLNGFTPPTVGSGELIVKFADDDRKKTSSGLNYRAVPYPVHRPMPPMHHQNMSHHHHQNMNMSNMMSTGPHCVFVYNVGTACTESDIYRLFAPFGALQKVDVIKDVETDMCKGYAFVNFYDRQDAQRAIMSLDGLYYNGRPLQVRFKNRMK